MRELHDLLRDQDGVVSRAQVLACGHSADDIRRRRRRREWVTLLPGVYVDHTGAPSWEQRTMAGVLHAASGLDEQHRPVGAALGGHTALRSAIGPRWRRGSNAPIEIVVDVRRTLRRLDGYRLVRRRGVTALVDHMRTPPRLWPAEATLDLALRAVDVPDAVAVIADACHGGYTSAAQVLAALDRRPRVAGRQQLTAVLSDVAEGTCSALEHLFLSDVVRRHGLPEPRRQAVRVINDGAGRRKEYRDAEWDDEGVVVELDGRAFHDSAEQRSRDLDRDLDEVATGRVVVRLSWTHATRQACRTAGRLATLLRARGWTGDARRCSRCSEPD